MYFIKKERGGKVDQNEQGDKAMQVSVPAFSRPVSEIADFFEENIKSSILKHI